MSRRQLLTSSASVGLARAALTRQGRYALSGAGALLAGCSRQRVTGLDDLAPVADETTGISLIKLPPGFRYKSYSWMDERLCDGTLVPGLHDGMGAILRENSDVVDLVRNHEIDAQPPFSASAVYDSAAGGGTTTLSFDLNRGEWLDAYGSLSGTIRNCAGGTTPWGSWLSCEEVDIPPGGALPRPHGYVFEVPAEGVSDGLPLTGLGRFRHEAAVVDPRTHVVYLTEDERDAGLYRFLPDVPGSGDLTSGRLEMLAVTGAPRDDSMWRVGESRAVHWVPIEDPDALAARTFDQGFDHGGKRFKRLEGATLAGRDLVFVSTTGGVMKRGQVWSLAIDDDALTLAFESWSSEVLDEPDNVVAVDAGLVICENSERAPTRLAMLAHDGSMRVFAENHVRLEGYRGLVGDFRGVEWCGACFVGDWLFVNIQSPGITFAITGDWEHWFADPAGSAH